MSLKKALLITLISTPFILNGCGSNTGTYQPRYTNSYNSVDSLHQRLDRYESNARTNAVYNTMNYNTNRGMGF